MSIDFDRCCSQIQVGVLQHSTVCTRTAPPLNSEIREEEAAAAVMTVGDDRDRDDVTITTSGYETFELQLQQQFYPGV
jgi:hypothetical protein